MAVKSKVACCNHLPNDQARRTRTGEHGLWPGNRSATVAAYDLDLRGDTRARLTRLASKERVMRNGSSTVLTAVFAAVTLFASAASADRDNRFLNGNYEDYYDGHGFYDDHGAKKQDDSVQLGPRPFYLVDGMDEGKLKD